MIRGTGGHRHSTRKGSGLSRTPGPLEFTERYPLVERQRPVVPGKYRDHLRPGTTTGPVLLDAL